uniref:HECT-type E3 ubiquitin transferase n=1 Tax=Albugo laibachii Nc14 TaxID=890382 RepID=F0WDW6_9STRA|nr:HECT E3 ubiquitin ligase putative [Albugo laibachii Nc14]|eukprot:CCA19394.1 HECT E3 ubiquitin ligase putative [Albugo laibachii Nc14]
MKSMGKSGGIPFSSDRISLEQRAEKFIPLNSRQEYARKRNEWVRQISKDGTAAWKRRNVLPVKKEGNSAKTTNTGPEEAQRSRASLLPLLSSVPVRPPGTLTSSFTLSTISMGRGSLGYITRLVRSSSNGAARLTFQNSKDVDASTTTLGTYKIQQEELIKLEQGPYVTFSKKLEWFLEQMQTLIKSWEQGRLKVRVHRENVLVESMEQLLSIQPSDLHLPLRIEFIDEVGIDAGGLQREWYALLFSKILDEQVGLFIVCHRENQSLCLNPNSEEHSSDHLLYFRGVGRLLGRALLDGYTMPAKFALPILKHLLGVPITFSDLQYVDPEIYSSMKWIRDNDGIESLELTYSVTEIRYGSPMVIDLKPQGRDIVVTDENKMEYLHCRLRYLTLDRYASQLQAFSEGFLEVIPQEKLMIFDYQELELVMCGLPQIHVDDWEAHTFIDPPTFADSDVVKWFWEVLRELNQEECARFLQFSTGSSRVPVQGFRALTSFDGRLCPFTIRPIVDQSRGFPKVHTCFNRIDLPVYESKEELNSAIAMLLQLQWTEFSVE